MSRKDSMRGIVLPIEAGQRGQITREQGQGGADSKGSGCGVSKLRDEEKREPLKRGR